MSVCDVIQETGDRLIIGYNKQIISLQKIWSSTTLIPMCVLFTAYCVQMRTPSNTPVTPPNFPDALASLAKMSTSDNSTTPTTTPPTQATRPNAVSTPPVSSVVPPLSHAH